MPCLSLPLPAVPPLPAPFSFGITFPQGSFDPNLCCKILPIISTAFILPPGLPLGVFNPAVIVAINKGIAALNAYKDKLVLPCPKE